MEFLEEMSEKRLIIAGIDPGTTTGYAILDLQGNIVSLKSSKNLGLNSLLEEVFKEGKVICVGTDRAKVPNLIELFSAKTGAKILFPKEDLRVEEKREIVRKFSAKNGHESDALAAALFAFGRIRSILDRIENYARENNKIAIKAKIADLVITKEISIREAADIIENPGKEESQIINKVIEKDQLRQKDFLRLYRIIKMQENELALLKRQNHNLKNYSRSLERKHIGVQQKEEYEIDKKIQKNLSFKNKSINFLEGRVFEKDKEIGMLKKAVAEFNSLLANIPQSTILKKLDNLGSAEFSKKFRELNISQGDILLVKNPNITSTGVIQFLKDKVDIIVTKDAPSKKIKEDFNFTFLEAEALNIKDHGKFASAPKMEIAKALESKTLLKSVIESYKQKKKEEITSLNP